MFGAIATWNGVPPVAVQRHVAYLSTHEGALHEQHRASHRVDAASRRADAPAAGTRSGRPAAAPQPEHGPTAPATAGRRDTADARRSCPGGRHRSARQRCWTASWPGWSTAIILGVTYGIIVGIVGGVFISGYRTGAEVYFYYLIIGVLSTIVYVGYFAYMESSRGQTLGKMVMKLKVFGPDGASNPTMEQAVRRNIYLGFGLLAIIPFVGWFVGWIAQVAAIILILDRDQRRPEAPALVRQVRRRHHGRQGRLTRHKLTHYDADPAESFCRVSAISETGQPRPTTVQTTIIASIAPPRTIAPIALPRL